MCRMLPCFDPYDLSKSSACMCTSFMQPKKEAQAHVRWLGFFFHVEVFMLLTAIYYLISEEIQSIETEYSFFLE